MERKLYKSDTNRVICGVCGGIGEYFGFDATIIRIIWALLICLGGTGFLAYLICALIMPRRPLY